MPGKGIFSDRFALNLDSVVTVEMIVILLVCYYVVHWLIYPEALEYLTLSLRGGEAAFSHGLQRYRDFRLLGSLGANVRFNYAAIECIIGLLEALLLAGVLGVSIRYFHKKTGRGFFKSISVIPWIAFIISALHILMFTSLILTYPALHTLQSTTAFALAVVAICAYLIGGGLLTSGIIRTMR